MPLARAREIERDMQTAGYFQTIKGIDENSAMKFHIEGTKEDD